MQSLKIYQSLWAMALRQPGVIERTDEESFRLIADAGFDGVCLDPAVHEIDECLAKRSLFEKYDLKCLINAFPKNDDDLRKLLGLSKTLGSPLMNIIGVTYPLTAKEAEPIVRRWIELSDEIGVPILFETHRDCITNDMFFTLELLDRVPEMRLCADFSHYALNRELTMPVDEFWEGLFERLSKR
jgi:sugar phosphate isomerase/epimerase